MGLSKEEAVDIARKEAREHGYDVNEFNIRCDEKPSGWDIYFYRDVPGILGESSHFSIFVDKINRKCQIFRGR